MSVPRLPPAAWTDLLTDAEGLGHRRPQVLGDRRLTHHVVVAVIVAYVVEDTELNGTEVGSGWKGGHDLQWHQPAWRRVSQLRGIPRGGRG